MTLAREHAVPRTAGQGPLSGSPAVEGMPTAPKRRKLRKGTLSCWECKRRKIRCTFAASTESICDGCRSRRTKCISQEFQDEAARAPRKVNRSSWSPVVVEETAGERRSGMQDTEGPSDADWNSVVRLIVAAEIVPASNPRKDQNCDAAEHDNRPQQQHFAHYAVSGPSAENFTNNHMKYLPQALLSVWPDQHDVNLILSVPTDVSLLFHGLVCMPLSRLLSTQITTAQQILQPPQHDTHPVLIARRLLLLGVLLQGIPPGSNEALASMRTDPRTILSRVVDTACRLVTSNDKFINSLEGIECIMIESMYQNNTGNLRAAWLTNRRAMVMAQLMGLHAAGSPPTMVLDPETRDRIEPSYMWFRIVCSDRYLSLMLGLPQGSPENVFAAPKALDACTPMERLERMQTVAGGLILQRNSAERTNFAATSKIDSMLREAAGLMSPKWWITAPDPAVVGNSSKGFEDKIRLMTQLSYQNLLVQLHLPYMMLPSSAEMNYDYSKMTAANASRAVITQFVAFRNTALGTAYCRGVDFIAFIASTTLCVAHIEAHRQYERQDSRAVDVFQSLQHQRLGDRGLLERTLEIMDDMAQANHDVVAEQISNILRPLLAIESDSANGVCYHTSASSASDEQKPQSQGDSDETVKMLSIQIPYFGTIKIQQDHSSSCAEDPMHSPPGLQSTGRSGSSLGGIGPQLGQPVGYEISNSQPVNDDWQAVTPLPEAAESFQASTSADWYPDSSAFGTSSAQESYLLVPGLAADVDDWPLQGVDTALFSSLTQVTGDGNEAN